jgi:hypothetical protein
MLGCLVRVPVREFWANEAREFTPWLAEEANLKLLGDAIEMELEPFRTEERIGPFRADIVAKEGDGLVIVENQLGATDHGHLGQLMVYATNRSAKAVVWIATEITDEYRKVLDWLNENTPETISFFGLEIELWRIGDSAPAPKFNVVCKPNELARLETGDEPTETKLLQREFWHGVREYAREKGSAISFRKPHPQSWYNLAVGRNGFHISLTARVIRKELGCELYISGRIGDANLALKLLETQKGQIESKLGELDWQPLRHAKACRIIDRRAGDIEDRNAWPELISWCVNRAEAFHATFSPIVQVLELGQIAEDEEEAEDSDPTAGQPV